METFDNIFSRRSVRSFTDEEVAQSDIDLIVRAGLAAPTGMNRQGTRLYVVRNRAILDELNELVKDSVPESNHAHFNLNGKFNFYRGGKILIIVTQTDESIMPEQDTGCAIQNMYLAANELNLGAVWINQLYKAPFNREFCAKYNIEGTPIASISIGHIKELPPIKQRSNKVTFLD